MSPTLHLSLPLRTDANDNRRFVISRGRLISSPAYREWKEGEAQRISLLARKAKWKRLEGGEENPLFVRISVTIPNRRIDGHNCLKGLLDAITASGAVWDDDRWVVPMFVPYTVGKGHVALVEIGTEPFVAGFDEMTKNN